MPEYSFDIEHAAPSSTKASACSVEPGSVKDMSEILHILGSTQMPFAVKGGGHATNPGFSSTRGIQIAMRRFNETKVNSASGTVEVGAGLTWDQVYATLALTGVNVVGGRMTGVGIAGLMLGGGYSYKTSQYGLALDNIAGYELVLPNGTVICVTSNDDDLWFGLRGIVTKFILKSHPQSDIWGGFLFYAENQLDAVKNALVEFQQKNDTKASVGVSLSYSSGQLSLLSLFFYDGPTSSGVFGDFLAIPTTGGNVSTMSFFDLIQNMGPLFGTNGLRQFCESIPVIHYSPALFDTFVNQTKLWGARLSPLDKNMTLSSALEPFDKGLFSHGSGSAYLPDRSHAVFPSVVTAQWSNASLDETMAIALRNMSKTINAAALADGQNVSHAAAYGNYALFGRPLEDLYGGNVERLRKIRAAIGPEDVMGLAGGWKF
ncbi:FAD-binding domain-containing protein [Russula ochroleuca]|uniref:FAD-binding domain-containing protein n=1 Tax=Russula ochroleuca TaxID=152965 RepID=A0A9P5N4Z0_9AGAM|nr:FAD-binding domain-containing protein [Russula ochroleuca]